MHHYEKAYLVIQFDSSKFSGNPVCVTLRIHYRGGGYRDSICYMQASGQNGAKIKHLIFASVNYAIGISELSRWTDLENDEKFKAIKFLSTIGIDSYDYHHGNPFTKVIFQAISIGDQVGSRTCYRFDVLI